MTTSEQERLGVLENSQRYMTEKIDSVDHKVDKLNDKFDDLLDKLEQKYAAKWVEWVIKGVVGLILLGVFGAIIKLVIK